MTDKIVCDAKKFATLKWGEAHDTDHPHETEDLVALTDPCEWTMLHNLRERFGRDRIYTRASSMLVVRLPTHRTPARARPLTRRPF